MTRARKYAWIASVLTNDETSTDTELLELFMHEGEMPREEAEYYVHMRSDIFTRHARIMFIPFDN